MLIQGCKEDRATRKELPAQMQIFIKSEKLKEKLQEAKLKNAQAKAKEKAHLDALYQLSMTWFI